MRCFFRNLSGQMLKTHIELPIYKTFMLFQHKEGTAALYQHRLISSLAQLSQLAVLVGCDGHFN
jgi:hypothetical protein